MMRRTTDTEHTQEASQMTKEIGGYMELEHFRGEEKYGDLYKFNLGRTAFVWLLKNIPHDRVFIPEYICDSVPVSAEKAGYKVVRYRLDEELKPVWGEEGAPSDNDILYLVSYYGQLTEEQIRAYHVDYPVMIVDNAQAFYDAPVREPGIHTIYTARKYFGLSDGAYVATNAPGAAEDYVRLDTDCSGSRMKHLSGRLEQNARDYYSDMLAVSSTFSDAKPMKMSPLTENFLRAIDYNYVQKKRQENYLTLSVHLSNSNPFTHSMPSCPFAYPFYHENGIELRKYLASQNIFVPTNWSYILRTMPENSLEYSWSADILPLPVDQRYGREEMETIADAIRSFDNKNSRQ